MGNDTKGPSWKSWAAAVAALAAVFTGLVLVVTLQSRQQIRQQILNRDGEVLAAVAQMLQGSTGELGNPELPADDLEVALQTSRLRGVLAVRLFDGDGRFTFAVPFHVTELDLEPADREVLEQGEPVARFHRAAEVDEIFEFLSAPSLPEEFSLQEVIIPLRDQDTLVGAVQYLIDGAPVQGEFTALDRTLWWHAGLALGVGIGALVLIAGLAFSRLSRSHRALADRTDRLAKANQELALAARTSAVGAVTSHLIHGIRNPLTGLDLFFQTQNTDELPGQSPESWRQLAEATNRIRELVDEVVEVLREQETTSAYELSLEELESVLHQKLAPKAEAAGVRFETERSGEGRLSGHAANILLLVVMNLVDNALPVTPQGRKVWVRLRGESSATVFEIGDEGPGIPEERRADLFTPGKSGRAGGSGLGLAISHRLAVHVNATLELSRSNGDGTVFVLRYPSEALTVDR